MKNFAKTSFWLALVPFLMVVSCKDDDVEASEPFDIMTEYMIAQNLDVSSVLSDWIVAAPAEADLSSFTGNYTIFDIRSADDFNDGRIDGAINTTLPNVLEAAQNATKPILVACYTGQSAGHAVMALRLSGYADAKVLKFGMSGWHTDLKDPWDGNTGDIGVGHTNWSTDAVQSNTTFENPSFTSSETTGEAILAERVRHMLDKGFQGVAGSDVLENPSNFFINNFWDQTDVDHYGHIDEAYRIKPLTLANEEFQYIDPSQTIVSYCWTGQTSSMLTAYLTVLGYDAKSLKFGVNGMIYSELESHKYAPPSVDLPVVTN